MKEEEVKKRRRKRKNERTGKHVLDMIAKLE